MDEEIPSRGRRSGTVPASDRATAERGQTSVDFAIAMGVFLVAVTTVVAFVPSIIQPFTGGQANSLLADRLVMQLVDYQLGDPATPSILNTTCTMYFFNGTDNTAESCASFEPDNPIDEMLGVTERRFVNVTLQANVSGGPDVETVCANADWDEVGECGTGGFDSSRRMATGPSPPTQSGSVTAARRKALLDDQQVYVVVKVW